MDVRVAGKSDVGRVRANNQDAFLDALPLVAVADGMGGHKAGEVASAMAIDVLREWKDRVGDPERLPEAVREANTKILERSRSDEETSGMGTTLTAAWVDGGTVTLAHVGDSRAYLVRRGKAEQLTEDDTVVQRWIDEGRIEADEAGTHPYRNYLEQALGIEPDVRVETLKVQLRPGDRVVLSSDGLHGPVNRDQLAKIVTDTTDIETACAQLVDAANEAGGEDNITVVIIEVPQDEESGEQDGRDEPVIVTRPAGQVDKQGAPPGGSSGPRSLFRRRGVLIGLVAAVVVLIAGVVVASTMSRAPSYIVAVSEGKVAIMKGRPGTATAPPKGDVLRVSDVSVEELPVSYQRQVEQGIVVSSLQEAEQTIRDLPRILGPTGQLPTATATPEIQLSPPPLPQQ